MRLVVLADDSQKEELFEHGTSNNIDVALINTVEELTTYENADGFIDLLFDGSPSRIELLKQFCPRPVIINSVVQTLREIKSPFTRINAWPGFLKRSVVEASQEEEAAKEQVQEIFLSMGKRTQWVPDEPGFITARVIAMIINEAWFALEEGISTKEQIDTAMKLGTNYPFGPFEWCNNIGPNNIFGLLKQLAKRDSRYTPAALLEKVAIT
jgi:3-hydroxybutyryl-CoA dehydrogenase